MTTKLTLLARRTLIFREGEGEGEGGEGGGEGGQQHGDDFEKPKFSQKDLNGMMAKSKRQVEALEKQTKEHVQQLKTLQESASLTSQERDELSAKITQLEEANLSVEEKAAKRVKDAQDKAGKELKQLTEERDGWRSRFTDSILDRALSDAGVAADAVSPTQIRSMFRHDSYLDENVGKDGKPDGTFTPKLKFKGYADDDKERKGSLVGLDLPVDEAIARIKADGQNANLFKGTQKEGTGAAPTGTGGPGAGDGDDPMPNPDDYEGDPAKYTEVFQAWRGRQKAKTKA